MTDRDSPFKVLEPPPGGLVGLRERLARARARRARRTRRVTAVLAAAAAITLLLFSEPWREGTQHPPEPSLESVDQTRPPLGPLFESSRHPALAAVDQSAPTEPVVLLPSDGQTQAIAPVTLDDDVVFYLVASVPR